jgi:cob(I)alamin adenosyltransferase
MTTPKTMTDSPDHAPKKPRRRLTPEQRIAERKAEIARIEEQQRERVRSDIDELAEALHEAESRAAGAGMTAEAARLHDAREALRAESA